MIAGTYDRAILLVLSSIQRLDVDVRLVEAYIAVGGKSLRNVTPHDLRRLVVQATESIDLDSPAMRREVLHTAGNPRKGDPSL